MAGQFNSWRRVDAARGALMKAQLQRLADSGKLSPNSAEIVTRALKA